MIYLHVGDGLLNEQEKEIAKNLKIEDKVIFFGKTEKVRELLVASDIFIMTSHYEGLPISLLEAMSCGLPSVAFYANGVKDLIRDNHNGYLVEPDKVSFVRAIENLLSNKDILSSFSKNAIQIIESDYDMQKSLNSMVKLYR